MSKPVIMIVVQERDIPTSALSVVDIMSHDLPTDGRIRDPKERAEIRKKIMSSLGIYVNMMLDGTADRMTIEREVR